MSATLSAYRTAQTPITQKAVAGQKKTHQGGYAFTISPLDRAKRFLILGSEGSFYQTGEALTRENAKVVEALAQSPEATQLIDLIVEVSTSGRAPKQSPGLFALALTIATSTDDAVRNYGYQALPRVARTASTLFEFISYFAQFQRLGGPGLHRAIGRWYMDKDLDDLAYQMVKYRSRSGYDHARLLRISKAVKSKERPEISPLLDWALGKGVRGGDAPALIKGYERAKVAPLRNIPGIIHGYGLTWEMVPSEALSDSRVWEALLDTPGSLPLGALVRQLPRLTHLGVIPAIGGRLAEIEDRLTDPHAIKRARLHPINLLIARQAYVSGKGRHFNWAPVPRVTAALEAAFYASFGTVEPTGKRWMLALDVSGSMGWFKVSESIPLTPAEISAVMAMVIARTEREHIFTAFSTNFVQVGITPTMTFGEVISALNRIPMGGTDLSLPMRAATEHCMEIDAFAVYTDNETGVGRTHPFEALQEYRKASGINAKMIVNAMTATRFSVADPRDAGSLDIAGFDSATPAVMAEFVRS